MSKKKLSLSCCIYLFLVSSAFAPVAFAASVETVGDLKVDGQIWSTSGGFKFPDGSTWTTGSMSGLLFNVGFDVDNSNSNAGNLNSGAIKFGAGATGEAVASQRIGSGNVNGLDLYTNSTSRLAITNSGFVGIGTRAPAFPLTEAAVNGQWTRAQFGNHYPLYLMEFPPAIGFNVYAPGGGVVTYGSTHPAGFLAFDWNTPGGFEFKTAPSAAAGTNIVMSTRLAITNDGKVGIGSTTPTQALDVVGNINASGNVTAGNITASGSLTGHDGYFTSSLNLDQGNTNNGGLNGAVLTFGNGSGEGIASKRTATGNQFGLDFYTNFNNRMSITNGGDVNVIGNVTVKGMMNMGSGTGTTEAPSNSIIVRKTNSLNNTAGNKVAVTDWLALLRNGTNGGFSISNTSAGWSGVVSCMGMNSANASVNKYLEVGPGPVTTALFSDADGVVNFQCNFGDPYGNGRITHVSLFRKAGDYMWLGTIISDVNQ
ncbi:MAG: hypothetical protein HXX11_19940 [Desulfuromonadales bacterium]|nr:hypothetical protein [Desulfuromonadales bacterium]